MNSIAAELAAKTAGPKSDVDPKAWAWRLRRRDMLGERLSICQRTMWRAALRNELAAREAAEAQRSSP